MADDLDDQSSKAAWILRLTESVLAPSFCHVLPWPALTWCDRRDRLPQRSNLAPNFCNPGSMRCYSATVRGRSASRHESAIVSVLCAWLHPCFCRHTVFSYSHRHGSSPSGETTQPSRRVVKHTIRRSVPISRQRVPCAAGGPASQLSLALVIELRDAFPPCPTSIPV